MSAGCCFNVAIGEDTKVELMDKIATSICQPFHYVFEICGQLAVNIFYYTGLYNKKMEKIKQANIRLVVEGSFEMISSVLPTAGIKAIHLKSV